MASKQVESSLQWYLGKRNAGVFTLLDFQYIKERLEARDFGTDGRDLDCGFGGRPSGALLYIDPKEFCERFSIKYEKGIGKRILDGIDEITFMHFRHKATPPDRKLIERFGLPTDRAPDDLWFRDGFAMAAYMYTSYTYDKESGEAEIHYILLDVFSLMRPIWGNAADVVEECVEAARHAKK